MAKRKKASKTADVSEEFEEVVIPAHDYVDGISMYEDGMAGKLTFASSSYIEAQYVRHIPEQVIRVPKKAPK